MKNLAKYITYLFPFKLFVLSAVFRSPAFAYASCLALALGLMKEAFDRLHEQKATKADDGFKHKVEQLEATISAMVARERARGF